MKVKIKLNTLQKNVEQKAWVKIPFNFPIYEKLIVADMNFSMSLKKIKMLG